MGLAAPGCKKVGLGAKKKVEHVWPSGKGDELPGQGGRKHVGLVAPGGGKVGLEAKKKARCVWPSGTEEELPGMGPAAPGGGKAGLGAKKRAGHSNQSIRKRKQDGKHKSHRNVKTEGSIST